MKTVNVCKTNGCLGTNNMCASISDYNCECLANGNKQCKRKVKIDINQKNTNYFPPVKKELMRLNIDC